MTSQRRFVRSDQAQVGFRTVDEFLPNIVLRSLQGQRAKQNLYATLRLCEGHDGRNPDNRGNSRGRCSRL
jgi:hypothetical protein